MVIAGCTFVGADWASGSMTNQLLFVPRRTRVWLAKAAAVTIWSGAFALVVISALLADPRARGAGARHRRALRAT